MSSCLVNMKLTLKLIFLLLPRFPSYHSFSSGLATCIKTLKWIPQIISLPKERWIKAITNGARFSLGLGLKYLSSNFSFSLRLYGMLPKKRDILNCSFYGNLLENFAVFTRLPSYFGGLRCESLRKYQLICISYGGPLRYPVIVP